MTETKPFDISKRLVWEAYKRVKANKGAAGVDRQSMAEFEQSLAGNLYRIWNRMSSGSYFPPPVSAVAIPKKSGGERILGVPTISDRIAQTVATLVLNPMLEPHFHEDSYGYRAGKSAHQALEVTRKRCWKYDWVLEYDIRGLYDHIDHGLLMKALRHHTDNRWVLLYVQRWLTAPMQKRDGSLISREVGTPQGGPLSPVLSNLFLHYALDHWLATRHKRILIAVQESGLPEATRDYAIQLMLSQLGIRSCEIANLSLDDIDWSKGQVLIRPGKTHQERALPLSQEVGNAIADYIQHARAQRNSRKVFLIACPPFTPFASPAAIGHIAKRAMHRAGITVHHGMAAHTFRHTVASEMVNKGATFKDVADVLGHRSLETTGIYAKLDLDNLLQVAMPWTGEAS